MMRAVGKKLEVGGAPVAAPDEVPTGTRDPDGLEGDDAAETPLEYAAGHVAERAAENRRDAAATGAVARKARSRGRGRDQRGSHGRRMVSMLHRDEAAMALLGEMGLTAETIATVGAGMREAYVRTDGTRVHGVLVYPVADGPGRTRYGCLALPGLTANAEHPIGWSAGRARSVCYGLGAVAIVCASALEAWLASQAAAASGVEITALASTRPDELPKEWEARRFWAGWERVLLSRGASRALAENVQRHAGRPIARCDAAPVGQVGARRGAEQLVEWIEDAVEGRGAEQAAAPTQYLSPGDFAAERVSVHGGLAGGRMYYAFAVERREGGTGGACVVYSYRTVVIRSDGALLEPVVLPAPQGTPADRRVHSVSDGTRIEPVSSVPDRPSWSLAGIERFALRMREERPYDGPSGRDLRDALVGFLRSTVWLPDPEAYGRVAAFVMATYFHRCFRAFPILYIGGPKGSGKSELTAAVVATAFNGALMSQGSAAALVRLARDNGGLIAIDDAEMLAAGFGELSQVLKTGHKASTAVKRLVGSGGSSTTIDFYGPRVLCNTRGLDDILLSRCLTVSTQRLPAGQQVPAVTDFDPGDWCDMMHDYAMSHVGEMIAIADAPRCWSRDDELALPLASIAQLIGD